MNNDNTIDGTATEVPSPSDLSKAMGKVVYAYAFGMTRENLRLNRELARLIDESPHFNDRNRQAAKDVIRDGLSVGGDLDEILAGVLSGATGEERDAFLREMAEASEKGEAEAREDDLNPGYVGEGYGPSFAGAGPRGEESRAQFSERVGVLRRTGRWIAMKAAAVAFALGLAASKVKQAARAAADGVKWVARKVAGGVAYAYAKTLGAAFGWTARQVRALGRWMSTKPVLRQVAAAFSWTAGKVGRGFRAAGRAIAATYRFVRDNIVGFLWGAAKLAFYAIGVLCLAIGAAVLAAVGLAYVDPERFGIEGGDGAGAAAAA